MTPRRRRALMSRGSCPNTTALPDVGAVRPVSIPIAVDLPAPLGPRRARSSPGRTSRSSPRTAWIVASPSPYCFEAPRSSARTPVSWPASASVGVCCESCVVVMPQGSFPEPRGSSARDHHLEVTPVMRCRGARSTPADDHHLVALGVGDPPVTVRLVEDPPAGRHDLFDSRECAVGGHGELEVDAVTLL